MLLFVKGVRSSMKCCWCFVNVAGQQYVGFPIAAARQVVGDYTTASRRKLSDAGASRPDSSGAGFALFLHPKASGNCVLKFRMGFHENPHNGRTDTGQEKVEA